MSSNSTMPSSATDPLLAVLVYSEVQLRTMAYVYYVTPPIALAASSLLIYAVFRSDDRRKRMLEPSYVRLIVGYSIMVVIQSIGSLLFGPWPVPKDTPYVYHAAGNTATCDVNGFFTNLQGGLVIYFACIIVYHALVVVVLEQNKNEEFISKRIEPFFHGISWLLPFGSSIHWIVMGYMNPIAGVPGFCYSADLPPDCTWNDDVDCIRGEGYWKYNVIASLIGLFLFFVILVSLALIYWKVRKTEQRLAHYSRRYRRASSAVILETTSKTGRQAILYIGAFLVCNLPVAFLQSGGLYEGRETYYFWSTIFYSTLSPLAGFFTSLIFFKNNPIFFQEGGPLYHVRWICCCCLPFHDGSSSSNGEDDDKSRMDLSRDLTLDRVVHERIHNIGEKPTPDSSEEPCTEKGTHNVNGDGSCAFSTHDGNTQNDHGNAAETDV